MSEKIVVFSVGDSRCALPLAGVEKVIRAVQISPLPEAPDIIAGAINLAGQILPVINLRRRFCFADRDLRVDDRFIIATTQKRTVALMADAVEGLREVSSEQLVRLEDPLAFAPQLRGAAKISGELILIFDLDLFLSENEERSLEKALKA